MTDPEIFLLRDGKRIGPYTLGSVKALLANKSISPQDLAWHEGLNDWMPVATLPLVAGQNRPDRKPLTVVRTKSGTSPIPQMVSTRVARITEQNKMISGMHPRPRPRTGILGIFWVFFGTALVITAFLYVRSQWIAKSWPRAYAQAIETAKEEKKFVFILFIRSTTDERSRKLQANALGRPPFRDYAQKNLVQLEVDMDSLRYDEKEIRSAIKRFKVEQFPTILLINGEGDMLARFGYREGGPEVWIEEIEGFK
jgi:hypothetical protein